MSEGECSSTNTSEIESELYFLVAKFLSSGPCKKAAEALQKEIEEKGLLSKRLDWLGGKHDSTYSNLEERNKHITGDHLVQICERIGPLLDKEIKPSVPSVKTILGTGRQSLLRTHKDLKGAVWSPTVFAATIRQHPIYPPCKLARTPNFCNVIRGRELSGRGLQSLLVPLQRYSSQICLFLRTLGHLSSVYCVAFDRTGTRIFTGADDHLVKVWCVQDGRLLATMRGHSSEIVDMNVNYENTLLAAGSIDKVIRVWNIQTLAPVAVLCGHTAMITSVEFSPYNRGGTRYMATTSSDGSVCLWQWNVTTNTFNPRPLKFQERTRAGAQMLCLSFSPGGTFLATGSSDPIIRVYLFTSSGPERLCELEAHTDRVDSIDFSHSGDRFVSGSKDGTARVWRYERQEWKSLVLQMSARVPGAKTPGIDDANKVMKHRVTMVSWGLYDTHVVTAVNDLSLRVWNSHTGKQVHELVGHTDEVFVLECHPKDPRIFLSGGHDGLLILWDLTTGKEVFRHHNIIEGQGHGAVFDCKFSPEGDFFASTDSHGHLSLFGWGPGKEKGKEREHKRYNEVPYEQFFHTDYRPLMRDANNYVLDEQTQQAPHLMPPPFLVDMDGNPHSPYLQRLVPGRENMNTTMLIPQMGVAPNGANEVLSADPVPEEEQRPEAHQQQEQEQEQQQERIAEDNEAASILDEMIARMQQEQDAAVEGIIDPADEDAALMPPPSHLGLRPSTPGRDRGGGPLSPAASPRGLRRSGEIEGVRQPVGNVPVSQPASQDDLLAWSRRVVTPLLQSAIARKMDERRQRFADEEMSHYKVERKKRRPNSPLFTTDDPDDRSRKKKGKLNHVYQTRANPEEEQEEEEEEEADEGGLSGAETSEEEVEWHSSSNSGSESSQYSDWGADAGINLAPPKRSTRKKRRTKVLWATDSGSDEDEPGPSKPKSARKRKIKPPIAVTEEPAQVSECPEDMKPSPWITDVIPRKCPYVPQMGDELVYLRQGHELYVKFVKEKKVYPIDNKVKQPYQRSKIREKELVKVVGIKYTVGPPTLCGLKLAHIEPDTRKRTGAYFTIKYHDMADVIDFLVLRQHYDQSMQRQWKVGDRFCAAIDDAWWFGKIVDHKPFQPEYPDSHFQCFSVAWDNGESELMSPWDLEIIDEDNLPEVEGGSVPINHDIYRDMIYTPMDEEWGKGCDQVSECLRISRCMEEAMTLRIAEMFMVPVDLEQYPTYPFYVPYPTDLSTILNRVIRRFYRRLASLQWEVRLIEQNAAAFNYPGSAIVKYSETLTKLLLEIIRDTDCTDAIGLYNRLTEEEDGLPVDVDKNSSEEDDEVGQGSSKTSNNKRKATASNGRGAKRKRSVACHNPKAWIGQCRELLQMMWDCQDSEPFRYPVDENVYPDYRNIISTPLDINTVREQLASGMYQDPIELGKDIRMIFANAKNYNTNKKSKISGMTLRLSALFEDHFRSVLSDYKSALNYEKQLKKGLKVKRRRNRSSAGPSSSRSPSQKKSSSKNNKSTSKHNKDTDDEDDDDDDDKAAGSSSSRRISSSTRASRNLTNSTTKRKQSLNTPSTSQRARSPPPKRAAAGKVKKDNDEDSSDVDASDDDTDTRKRARGKTKTPKRTPKGGLDTDEGSSEEESAAEEEESDVSEEEEEKVTTKPKAKSSGKSSKGKGKLKGKKKLTNGFSSNKRSSPRKRPKVSYDEDDEEDEETEHHLKELHKKVSSSEEEETEESNSDTSNSSNSDSENSSASSDSDSSDASPSVTRRTRRGGRTNNSRHSSKSNKKRTRSKQPTRKRTRRYSEDSDYDALPTRTTRSRRMVSDKEEEDSDGEEEEGSDDDEEATTVSSRGRVRRLTQRAKARLLGD